MRIRCLCAVVFFVCGSIALAGERPSPKFTKKPTAARADGKVTISFAVDRATDVAVFIEDGKGKIVRHLVAGVLGKNPPPPLKPGLSQSVEWDGKANYGKPAGSGPFRVRAALGLGAEYDRVLAEEPMNVYGPKGGVKGLACAADGTLYVLHVFGGDIPNWPSERVVAVSREGKYLKTVTPWPAGLPAEKVAGFGVMDLDGRPAPTVKSVPQRTFYRGLTPRKTDLAVTGDGVVLKLVSDCTTKADAAIGAYASDGSAVWGGELGPRLFEVGRNGLLFACICVSSDGKHLYLSNRKPKGRKKAEAAVFRVRLPERGPAEAFFGDPAAPGNDQTHLSDDARGLAVDGKGRLYIADTGNNRVVVVSEKDGEFVGAFDVEKPQHVGVHPASGEVYVTRQAGKGVELARYSGFKDARELAKLPVKGEGDPKLPWAMALDAGAEPPIVWMGGDRGSLLRITQAGGKFSAENLCTRKYGDLAFVGIEVDHFRREKEIYVRLDGGGHWLRYGEADGKFEKVSCPGTGGSSGTCIVPGPKGNLYAPAWPYHLLRYDRGGKPLPWEAGVRNYPAETLTSRGNTEKPKPVPNGLFVPVSMVYMTHTFGIRHDGHFFMFQSRYPRARPPKKLIEFAPDGKRVSDQPIIWMVSDTAIGPKFDQQGNIYIAEQVKPEDRIYPPEIGKYVAGKERAAEQRAAATMYGSVLKFSPKGGMVHFDTRNGAKPFDGAPQLDSSLKRVEAVTCPNGSVKPAGVTGALWMKMGISHVDLHYCNCENTRFDVDEFGRVWYPDLNRFRAVVLDTAGNEITHFGGYGNPENRGPESAAEGLKQPDIALGWLIGVGATDRYVYLPDSMNRRLLRAKITYAAEETCDVK
jgi:hypothetical protein